MFQFSLKLAAMENHVGKNRKAEKQMLLVAASKPKQHFIKQHCMGRTLLISREFQIRKRLAHAVLFRNRGPCLMMWKMFQREAVSPLLIQQQVPQPSYSR